METITLSELRHVLGSTIDRTNHTGQRAVTTRNGHDAAMIVSTRYLALLIELEDHEDCKNQTEDDKYRISLHDLLTRLKAQRNKSEFSFHPLDNRAIPANSSGD